MNTNHRPRVVVLSAALLVVGATLRADRLGTGSLAETRNTQATDVVLTYTRLERSHASPDEYYASVHPRADVGGRGEPRGTLLGDGFDPRVVKISERV